VLVLSHRWAYCKAVRTRTGWLSALALCGAVLVGQRSSAQDGSQVVVRVGELSLDVATVGRRFAALSGPERQALGETPAAALSRYVEGTLVPELLAAQAARTQGLDKTPRYADREREALRSAVEANLKQETLKAKPVSDQEVKAYFDANESRFKQPLRVRLWRILVDDAATAKAVLAEAKAAGTPTKWSELARDKSVDKATSLRQGDLGFVHPDGQTDVPRVRVDPALFKAAQTLKDGELATQPVAEGAKFAVLWRRGSLPAKARSLEQEKDSIRSLLERRRVDEARTALLTQLRQDGARDVHPEPLAELPEGYFGGRPARPKPPLTQHGAANPAAPSASTGMR